VDWNGFSKGKRFYCLGGFGNPAPQRPLSSSVGELPRHPPTGRCSFFPDARFSYRSP
jgi:hypothetical protein